MSDLKDCIGTFNYLRIYLVEDLVLHFCQFIRHHVSIVTFMLIMDNLINLVIYWRFILIKLRAELFSSIQIANIPVLKVL